MLRLWMNGFGGSWEEEREGVPVLKWDYRGTCTLICITPLYSMYVPANNVSVYHSYDELI